jgi:hypothetical protein
MIEEAPCNSMKRAHIQTLWAFVDEARVTMGGTEAESETAPVERSWGVNGADDKVRCHRPVGAEGEPPHWRRCIILADLPFARTGAWLHHR